MMSISWCIPAGLIVFGWTVEKKVHWIVPNIGSVIFAIGNYAVFQVSPPDSALLTKLMLVSL